MNEIEDAAFWSLGCLLATLFFPFWFPVWVGKKLYLACTLPDKLESRIDMEERMRRHVRDDLWKLEMKVNDMEAIVGSWDQWKPKTTKRSKK